MASIKDHVTLKQAFHYWVGSLRTQHIFKVGGSEHSGGSLLRTTLPSLPYGVYFRPL